MAYIWQLYSFSSPSALLTERSAALLATEVENTWQRSRYRLHTRTCGGPVSEMACLECSPKEGGFQAAGKGSRLGALCPPFRVHSHDVESMSDQQAKGMENSCIDICAAKGSSKTVTG